MVLVNISHIMLKANELLIILPTRPCINYSVSLEAVVWDGEQEEAFQYQPVNSKINYYHGDNNIKKVDLIESFSDRSADTG